MGGAYGASVYSAGDDSQAAPLGCAHGRGDPLVRPGHPDRVTLSPDLALVTREGGAAALFDLGARGEVGYVDTCHGFVFRRVAHGDRGPGGDGDGRNAPPTRPSSTRSWSTWRSKSS